MARHSLFTELDQPLFDALQRVAQITGLTKRAVIEATIADKIGADHIARTRVRQGWAAYRKETTPNA